jgi:hypothetical protein
MNPSPNVSPFPSAPGSWTFRERLGGLLVLLLVLQLFIWPRILAPRFSRVFADLLGSEHPLPAVTHAVVHTRLVAWLALFPLATMVYAWRGNLSPGGRRAAIGSALAAGVAALLFCGFAVLMPLSQLILCLRVSAV